LIKTIIKRDGRKVPYEVSKIQDAVLMAAVSIGLEANEYVKLAEEVAEKVDDKLCEVFNGRKSPTVEQVQDVVEEVLVSLGHASIAKEYILYRAERNRTREMRADLMKIFEDLTFVDAKHADMKRENANIDADTAMGTMLKYGSEAAKEFNHLYLLDRDVSDDYNSGDIHIHDLDFYSLTETCCQIPLDKLFEGGFSTGHGYLREPESIRSYAALTAIALQCNQNEMHGGQSIPALDYYLAPGVAKTYVSEICQVLEDRFDIDEDVKSEIKKELRKQLKPLKYHIISEKGNEVIDKILGNNGFSKENIDIVLKKALKKTEKETYQAMEALVHNLNSMHSRAGAQVPFTSANLGTDISEEGRMVTRNLLLATEAGLGAGETAIFPISIFKVKDGVNYNPEDPNYDLFKLSIRVSAKRLFPTYEFLDAPFNLQYYKKGDFRTELATMGCRTRVIGNAYDPKNEVAPARGNLSFTSINLPRLGIESKGDLDKFFELLDEKMFLVKRQLIKRFKFQCTKHVYNYPFLMGQGLWLGSDKLGPEDSVESVLGQGTLSIGFIGLAECLTALIGEHHGQSDKAQELGLKIIGHMREMTDAWQKEWYTLSSGKKVHLNWSVLGTPAEGLSGTFVRKDKKKYGVIKGVTDKDYYTNSSHIPVGFQIGFVDKIKKEAPYHNLENAGHICYIEFDGDATQNLDAFEAIIRCMKENGVGYGAINVPVDRDPVCGYTGIIGDICPRCGRDVRETISQREINTIRKKFGLTTNYNLSHNS